MDKPTTLPNSYHLGVATCCHCSLSLLASQAVQCGTCRSANYCSEKCLHQHAMSLHTPAACQAMLKATSPAHAKALATEVSMPTANRTPALYNLVTSGPLHLDIVSSTPVSAFAPQGMPRWEFFAGDVPSLHFWLDRHGLCSPDNAWAALDLSAVPLDTATQLDLEMASPLFFAMDGDEDDDEFGVDGDVGGFLRGGVKERNVEGDAEGDGAGSEEGSEGRGTR